MAGWDPTRRGSRARARSTRGSRARSWRASSRRRSAPPRRRRGRWGTWRTPCRHSSPTRWRRCRAFTGSSARAGARATTPARASWCATGSPPAPRSSPASGGRPGCGAVGSALRTASPMVSAPVGRVVSRGVTHEELRPLLAGYAAGTLDEAGCEVVRAHLADGCVACLLDVFDRPVGLPRTPPAPAASPPPEPEAADGARPRRGLRQVAVGLGLVLAALGVWAIGELRGREAAYRDQATSVAAAAADLEAPLAAVAPFRDVRGHVLWQPAHETALLYASGLPRLPAGSTYRVRLGLDDGREQAGPSFGPDARGTLALAIRVGPAAERLRAVRVVLEPAGEPVLAGERSR